MLCNSFFTFIMISKASGITFMFQFIFSVRQTDWMQKLMLILKINAFIHFN